MSTVPIPTIPEIPPWALAIGGIVLAWFLLRPRDVAEKTIGIAGEVISGTVAGVGNAAQSVAESLLGIPKTDKAKCVAARQKGNTFDTLTYCSLVDDLIFGEAPKRPAAPKAPPKAKATAPGGGSILDSGGPSFSDVLNDPYGIGMSVPNYFLLNATSETQREQKARDIVSVAGIRG